MSNTNSSENNIKSPSDDEGYKEDKKKEKQSTDTNISSSNIEITQVEGRELEEGQTFQY